MKRAALPFDELRREAAQIFKHTRSQVISETTPTQITPEVRDFVNSSLGGLTIERVPVEADQYGLYGWCSDGVLEKVRHDGGAIRFGWTIWEWPSVMLTAEFHAVWMSDSGRLIDITPKPHGESDILFVPDASYSPDFDFELRPRNRRVRVYKPVDNADEVRHRIANMKPAQLDYERRRASRTQKTLEEWVGSKMTRDTWPQIIDEFILACAALERKMDEFPAGTNIVADDELILLTKHKEAFLHVLQPLRGRARILNKKE